MTVSLFFCAGTNKQPSPINCGLRLTIKCSPPCHREARTKMAETYLLICVVSFGKPIMDNSTFDIFTKIKEPLLFIAVGLWYDYLFSDSESKNLSRLCMTCRNCSQMFGDKIQIVLTCFAFLLHATILQHRSVSNNVIFTDTWIGQECLVEHNMINISLTYFRYFHSSTATTYVQLVQVTNHLHNWLVLQTSWSVQMCKLHNLWHSMTRCQFTYRTRDYIDITLL